MLAMVLMKSFGSKSHLKINFKFPILIQKFIYIILRLASIVVTMIISQSDHLVTIISPAVA